MEFVVGVLAHASRERMVELLPDVMQAMLTLSDNNLSGSERLLELMGAPDGSMLRQPFLLCPCEDLAEAVATLLLRAGIAPDDTFVGCTALARMVACAWRQDEVEAAPSLAVLTGRTQVQRGRAGSGSGGRPSV